MQLLNLNFFFLSVKAEIMTALSLHGIFCETDKGGMPTHHTALLGEEGRLTASGWYLPGKNTRGTHLKGAKSLSLEHGIRWPQIPCWKCGYSWMKIYIVTEWKIKSKEVYANYKIIRSEEEKNMASLYIIQNMPYDAFHKHRLLSQMSTTRWELPTGPKARDERWLHEDLYTQFHALNHLLGSTQVPHNKLREPSNAVYWLRFPQSSNVPAGAL